MRFHYKSTRTTILTNIQTDRVEPDIRSFLLSGIRQPMKVIGHHGIEYIIFRNFRGVEYKEFIRIVMYLLCKL